ncbi:MAG: hypothetical protein AAGI25_14450 [Bacteroidota bacterium]
MEKALNEIGKLRTEMHVGFIELENQISFTKDQIASTRNQMNESFIKVGDSLGKVIDTTKKIAGNVERGFLAVEEAMQEDVDRIDKEIQSIKDRLDRANI